MDLSEIKTLVEAQGRAWEEFKTTNDERLAKLAKGEAVADLEAKLAKINDALTKVTDDAQEALKRASRPAASAKQEDAEKELKRFQVSAKSHAARLSRQAPVINEADYQDYKSSFRQYLASGLDHMTDSQRKAINVGTDPEGGYLTDSEMDAGIDRVVAAESAMRSISRVVTIGSTEWKKLVKTSGASAGGWGGETTAPTETNTQGWVELSFVPGMVWAEPRATQQSLEDGTIDFEADLINELGITFADQEAQAFIDGTGVNKPKGFLAYNIVANASYAWGSLGYTASGHASSWASSNPSDALVDLQHTLKRNYRNGAIFLMNDATLGSIRKFKDGNGIYLWAPSALLNGAAGQLLGHPVVTDDYMPDLGSNAYPVAFGNFKRGYAVVDRRGTTILRDPFTAKPYVKFWATRRVGGGVINFEAIKVLKCATS